MNEKVIVGWISFLVGCLAALFVVTRFVTPTSAQQDCLAQELHRYDKLWHETCLKDGFTYNCDLPKQQTDVMGWGDHMKRAKECYTE